MTGLAISALGSPRSHLRPPAKDARSPGVTEPVFAAAGCTLRGVRLLALALSALALTGASPPKWLTFRSEGISVRYPPTWHATAKPLTPVTSPSQMLAVGSFPLPRDSRGADGCEPREALDRIQPAGAFIFGWDYGTRQLRSRDFPPRPRHFKLVRFSRYECFGPSYMLRFHEAGRYFQIHVAFGRMASAATRATTLRILDSLTVKRT